MPDFSFYYRPIKIKLNYSRTEVDIQMKQNGTLIHKPTKLQLSDFFFLTKMP